VLGVPAELFDEELQALPRPIAIALVCQPVEIVEVDATGPVGE